jgi:hypothetical protein
MIPAPLRAGMVFHIIPHTALPKEGVGLGPRFWSTPSGAARQGTR